MIIRDRRPRERDRCSGAYREMVLMAWIRERVERADRPVVASKADSVFDGIAVTPAAPVAPRTPRRRPRSTPALIEVKAFAVSRAQSPVESVATFAMIAIARAREARWPSVAALGLAQDVPQLALDGRYGLRPSRSRPLELGASAS